MKIVIAIKQYKDRAKSSFICFKNLVFFKFILFLDVKNVFIACLIQQFNPLLPF
jgi:hypothetical protein